MKKLFTIVFVIAVIAFVFLKTPSDFSRKDTLYAANFAIYDALVSIVPDSGVVKLFIPAGEDIHSIQPNPQMLAKASLSKRVFYVKGSLSGWMEHLVHGNHSIAFTDLSSGLDWIEGEVCHDHEEEHHDHENSYDPHYWLSIPNQIQVASNLLKELKTIYPKQKDLLTKNYEKYSKSLKAVDAEAQKTLQTCKINKIVVTHNAFSYLAKNYHFKVRSIVGLTPESLSNPKKLKNIIELIRDNGPTTIFFEDFISDLMAQTISKEVNVTINKLHPLATISYQEMRDKVDYETLMRENILKIAKAMQCQ